MIELLILYVLLNRDLTMYAIHSRILDNFRAYTNPSFGAIKPALVRLEKKGCIKSAKIMSEGGKLSVFYSITKEGLNELKKLLLQDFTLNPLQFISDASVKLSCIGFLDEDDKIKMLDLVKSNAMRHKINAQNTLTNEYNPIDIYQKIVLDNTVCMYSNLISVAEGFYKK